jgi:nitrate/TMAO reductase-like tetraheme cytochrome c subunit
MRRISAAVAASSLWAAAAGASPSDFGVPSPHGWIGTTNDWIQGIGLVLALLNVILLIVIWQMVRRRGVTPSSKALLLGGIVVLPAIVVFLATAHGMQESMTVDACGDCHVMKGHVADLRNPASDSLAAVHYKNRYIQTDQCYTCHSDYGMFGTMSAKMEGLGHVYHNIAGNYPKPIKIKNPYSNLRCLSCHGGAQNFLAKHDKESIPNLMANKDSCLDCHGPAHHAEGGEAPAKQASREAIP